MSKLHYLPVITGMSDFDNFFKDKRLAWWMDNCLYPTEGILMSAYNGIGVFDSRESLGLRDDVIFFGDSGGFQLLTIAQQSPQQYQKVKAKLHPQHILDWQQDCCNIGMTLDIPLPRNHIYSRDLFNKHLSESKAAGDYMRSHQNKDALKLYDVIHGANPEDMKLWLDATTSDYSFDGFSFSCGARGNITTLSLILGFAIENLDKSAGLHVLGASSIPYLYLMAYATKYLHQDIYYDSSTYATGRMYREYLNPFDWKTSLTLGTNGDQQHRFYGDFCPCPVCSELAKDMDFSPLWIESNPSLCGPLISIHNLFWYERFKIFLEDMVLYNEDIFLSMAKSHSRGDQIMKGIQFIQATAEEGLERAYSRYALNNTQYLNSWY